MKFKQLPEESFVEAPHGYWITHKAKLGSGDVLKVVVPEGDNKVVLYIDWHGLVVDEKGERLT